MSNTNMLLKEMNDVLSVHPDLLSEAKYMTNNIDRTVDGAIINTESGGSLTNRKDGTLALVGGTMAQFRADTATGKTIEQSIESSVTSVRRTVDVDELLINNRKLNPDLYELADMKQISNDPNSMIGNLTVMTTVLVKAWEPTLKKWVLIRRLARTPVFSPVLNLPNAPEDMDLKLDISEEILKITKRGVK